MKFSATSPENAADLLALKQIVLSIPIGATALYAEMTRAIGRDVRSRRWLLTRAIAEAEEETGGLFATVRGEGIMRLESGRIPDVGLSAIQKIRRTAKRGHARLASVRVNDLPLEGQQKILAHRSQLGAISLVADGRKTATLTAEVAATGQTIPVGRVLELFAKANGTSAA